MASNSSGWISCRAITPHPATTVTFSLFFPHLISNHWLRGVLLANSSGLSPSRAGITRMEEISRPFGECLTLPKATRRCCRCPFAALSNSSVSNTCQVSAPSGAPNCSRQQPRRRGSREAYHLRSLCQAAAVGA